MYFLWLWILGFSSRQNRKSSWLAPLLEARLSVPAGPRQQRSAKVAAAESPCNPSTTPSRLSSRRQSPRGVPCALAHWGMYNDVFSLDGGGGRVSRCADGAARLLRGAVGGRPAAGPLPLHWYDISPRVNCLCLCSAFTTRASAEHLPEESLLTNRWITGYW